MALPEKVSKALDKARTCWAVSVILYSCWSMAYLPLWCILLIPLVAIALYFLTLFLVVMYLSARLSDAELDEAERATDEVVVKAEKARDELASRPHTPEETTKVMHDAGMTDHVEVSETGPVVGTYRDNELFEWVLVQPPGFDKAEKFMYYGPTDYQRGVPFIPEIPNHVFANINGVLYVWVQPEKE